MNNARSVEASVTSNTSGEYKLVDININTIGPIDYQWIKQTIQQRLVIKEFGVTAYVVIRIHILMVHSIIIQGLKCYMK